MAQTNQPMGSSPLANMGASPLANMQANLGANMAQGQTMPAGWQNQMLAMRGMQPPQPPGAGAAQPVPQNPQLMDQLRAQMPPGRLNTMQPRPPMGAPGQGAGGGKAPGQAGVGAQQVKQQVGQLPGGPPPGAPGRGAAGKAPGAAPMQQQMKQQIAGL